MEFLAGNRLLSYQPHVYFPKDMKLEICTKVEGSQNDGWCKLAEAAQIPTDKSHWLKTYTEGKQVTPCYVVLEFIEARLIAKGVGVDEAYDQLSSMLDKCGFEVAADVCKSWKAGLVEYQSPHKNKRRGTSMLNYCQDNTTKTTTCTLESDDKETDPGVLNVDSSSPTSAVAGKCNAYESINNEPLFKNRLS